MQKIFLCLVAGTPLGILSYLLLSNKISTLNFSILTVVWTVLMVFIWTDQRLELVKIILQTTTVIFAFVTLIITTITFLFEGSPLLIIKGAVAKGGEGKLYLLVENIGKIPAYQIHGAYVVTAAQEPSSQKTSDERVLAFNKIKHEDEPFYPGVETNIIVEALKLEKDLTQEEHHIFLSVAISYPRMQIFRFTLPFPKGYEAVFGYDRKTGDWVSNSKTIYPDFFAAVFKALKKGEAPNF